MNNIRIYRQRGKPNAYALLLLFTLLISILPRIARAQNVDSLVQVISHSRSAEAINGAKGHLPVHLSKIDMKMLDAIVQMRAEGINRANALQHRIKERFSNPILQIDDAGNFHVEVYMKDVNSKNIDQLKTAGATVEYIDEHFKRVTCSIPFDAVEVLSKNENILTIASIEKPKVRIGSYTTAGDGILKADVARTSFGINGSNFKVGVISDGVDHWTNSRDQGDLPSNFQVINNRFGGDEGTAMSEIVYDLAQGSSLAFADYGYSQGDFADNIDRLKNAGCNVIVDDIIYFAEPAFEDGTIAQRVDSRTADGVKYFSACGNEGTGTWDGMSADANSNTWMEFSGSDETNSITIPSYEYIIVVLQWANQWTKSRDDYDLYLFAGSDPGSQVLASGTYRQSGSGNPYEIIYYPNYGQSPTVYLRVKFYSVNSPRELKLVAFASGSLHYITDGGIYGHAAASTCISVGTMNASSPNTIAYYSSHGPSRIYSYDANGDPVSYVDRATPTICGIDGVETYVGESGLWLGYPYTFYGTSAAAPHVAAISALLLSLNSSLNWQQTKDVMTAVATKVSGMGGQNFTNAYGWGRVDAYQAGLLALAYSNKSDYYAATSYNNNHILEKDDYSNLHSVFMSGGEIFYRRSTNGGSTWDIVTRISDGSGLNAAPCISTAFDGTLHMVWQRSNGGNYDLCYALSTNLGGSWSTSMLLYPTPVAGSYTGQGLNPVILGMNGSQRKLLCVWAQSDGLHYKTSNSTTSWNGETGLVPGTQYNGWVQHPSLASFGSSLTATTAIYDDTYDVYSNRYDANSNTWSSRATAGNGSNDRLSSIAYGEGGDMYGVWSRFNGSRWVVRCSYGDSPSNTWNYWYFDIAGPGNLNSFYPSASWWMNLRPELVGLSVVWSAYGSGIYTIQQADYDWDGGWGSPYQISDNGIFANLTHEWLGDNLPTKTCSHMPNSPYHLDIAQPGGGLAKKSIAASAKIMKPYRAVEIHDNKSRATLTVKLKGLNFKKYDYKKKLNLTLANVFDYLQTEDFGATAGALMDVQVENSVMQQDTLEGKDISKIDRSRFASIDMSLQIMEGESKAAEIALLVAGQAKSSKVKKSLALDQFASRSVHLIPKASLTGSFDEKDLSFALVNGEEEVDSSGSATPVTASIPGTVNVSNYPNPFNPSTRIQYAIPQNSVVTLKVFDVLGREVATLVDEFKPAGYYEAQFDASHLSSGIYFYQIQVGGLKLVKKMLLMK